MPEPNPDSFPSRYDPKPVEAKWYKFWEESGFFTANAQSKKPKYSIVIPPPNVTGSLHMGHALDNGLPDILAKPWSPRKDNAVGGKMFVLFLENLGRPG